MAEELGIVSWTPLWHQSGHEHLRGMIEHGFEIMITGVSAEGLTEAWLGRILDQRIVEELAALASKHRFHVEGEGGEYETLVVGGPHMDQRLSVEGTVHWDGVEGITPFTEWLAVRARRTRRQFHLQHPRDSWDQTWPRVLQPKRRPRWQAYDCKHQSVPHPSQGP